MNESEKTSVVSSLQPSGRPHLGNYFGAMKPHIEMQDEYDENMGGPETLPGFLFHSKVQKYSLSLNIATDSSFSITLLN